MSIALQNKVNELEARIVALEELLGAMRNGSDVDLEVRVEARLKKLEGNYMALNARMGKSIYQKVMGE